MLEQYVVDSPYDMKKIDGCLGAAYTTIAEARMLDVLTSTKSINDKSTAISAEYDKMLKFGKQYKHKIKQHMHGTIKAEADSILVDA